MILGAHVRRRQTGISGAIEEAVARIDPAQLDQLLHPMIDPSVAAVTYSSIRDLCSVTIQMRSRSLISGSDSSDESNAPIRIIAGPA